MIMQMINRHKVVNFISEEAAEEAGFVCIERAELILSGYCVSLYRGQNPNEDWFALAVVKKDDR